MSALLEYKSFSFEEYKEHIKKLQTSMKKEGCDCLLLTMPENIYYATGYKTWYSSSLFRPVICLVPQTGEPALILRILEKSTVLLYSWVSSIYCWGSSTRDIGELDAASLVESMQKCFDEKMPEVKTIGIEKSDGLHFYSSLEILQEIESGFMHKEFVDGSLAIQKARMIKTPWEIDCIRDVCSITEKAIQYAAKHIVPGKTTEKDVANMVASQMCAKGVDRISYLTIISGQDKYSTFNAYATNRVIQKNEIVLFDISGHLNGYASDLTRVFYTGKVPMDLQAMADVSLQSIVAGKEAIRVGKTVGFINEVCENIICNSIYKDYLVHSSGHGIGLQVVEYPMIQDNNPVALQEGMVFALEQGVYPFNKEEGAQCIQKTLRCEDEVLVTKDGAIWLSGPGVAIQSIEDIEE